MKQIKKKYTNPTNIANKLARENYKIVYKVIHDKFKGMNHDNLISIGMATLVDASYNYNQDSKIKFSTYAYSCVYFKILTYLKKEKLNNENNILVADFSDDNNIVRDINTLLNKRNQSYEDIEELSKFNIYEIGWESVKTSTNKGRTKNSPYKRNIVVKREDNGVD